MMYSDKLEDIPKERYQDLMTFLSRVQTSGTGRLRRSRIVAETSLDAATVQTILSELSQEGILQAKIEIHCPHCTTQHGIFARKSAVPEEKRVCFDCGREFTMDESRNWEVIYEFTDNAGDFFQNDEIFIKRFAKAESSQPPEYFRIGLDELRSMENPQKRGRIFDYFIGHLFQQLDGVEVRFKETTDSGEVDVHVHCLDAPERLYRLLGMQTIVENKWESDPIEKGEITKFYAKLNDAQGCNYGYFVSMSGYSRGKGRQIGALGKLREYRNPVLVDLWSDHVERMVEEGSPEGVMEERILS